MKLVPLAELGYRVWATSHGWAIGLTQQEAESADKRLYQHPTRESAEDALEWSYGDEEEAA